ncbi:MAG TPA: EAL domain-containing protein [Acidimicrobiales bacterium]|nr:EAL domain-containing protein [Acidimicrobiales bacterium]
MSPGTQAAAISTVAAGACAAGALAMRGILTPGRAGRPWALLTLAMVVIVVAAGIWEAYALVGRGRPLVSPADGLYLLAYPLIACAVGLLVVIRTPQGWRDGLVDGAAIAVSAGLAIWQFLIVNTGLIDDGELFQRTVLASYPLVDVVLVAALLWLLLMPGRRCASVWFLSTGLALMLAADLAQNAVGLLSRSTTTQWVDPWYVVSFGMLALAAAHPSAETIARPAQHMARPGIHPTRLLLLAAALLFPPVLAATGPSLGYDMNEGVVIFVAAFVTTIVVTRLAVLLNAANRAREKSARAEAELAHQATHDALTDLPNRVLLLDRTQHAIDLVGRRRGTLAVLFLDLDHFKMVNDSLGHKAGDVLLRQAAERIRAVVRVGDTVARLGGDEFVVLCEDLEDVAEAEEVAERVIRTLNEPFDLDGFEAFVSASVGIALATDADVDAGALLRDADIALYQAKEDGRGRCELFDSEMRAWVASRHDLENALRHAVTRGELFLVYQPRVDLRSGHLVGFEALVRWQRPGERTVLPEEFIPIAEALGLINSIGGWVLDQSVRQLELWNRQFPDKSLINLSINVSARQLNQPGLVEHLDDLLTSCAVSAQQIVLELTETFLVKDPEIAVLRLEELRELGVGVAVDDFGTGYSSLAYLRQFPLDSLKIDKSFVNNLGVPGQDTSVVAAMIALGHALGHRVTAEGVETSEQMKTLQHLGCDEAQGYYFARPLTLAEAEAIVREPQLVPALAQLAGRL